MYLPTVYSLQYYPGYVSNLTNNTNNILLNLLFISNSMWSDLYHTLEKINGLLKQYQIYVLNIVN